MRHRNDPEGLAGRKLYIGGLLEDVRKEELTKELARFGPLDDVWIARNPPGFAFVVYQRDADAERCARALDGMNVCGSRIRVEFAHRLHKDAPPSGKFGGGGPPFGRHRTEPTLERGGRGGSDYERGPPPRSSGAGFDRAPRSSYSERPGFSGRSQSGRTFDTERPTRPHNSDRVDRYSSRSRFYDAPPRRGNTPYSASEGASRSYRQRYSPSADYDDEAGPNDVTPSARPRGESYRSRSPGTRSRGFAAADNDDFEPPVRRAPPPDDGYDVADYEAERTARRRSPYSPPTDLRSRRFQGAGSSDVGYRRGVPPADEEPYGRGPAPFRAERDRSPLPYRRTATDEYAGYYGNQTPPPAEHEERGLPPDEDEFLPYDAPSPVRLGRPR